jgi:hypothetical protein
MHGESEQLLNPKRVVNTEIQRDKTHKTGQISPVLVYVWNLDSPNINCCTLNKIYLRVMHTLLAKNFT